MVRCGGERGTERVCARRRCAPRSLARPFASWRPPARLCHVWGRYCPASAGLGVLGGASGATCACVVERHGSTWMGMLVACVARIGYVVHGCSYRNGRSSTSRAPARTNGRRARARTCIRACRRHTSPPSQRLLGSPRAPQKNPPAPATARPPHPPPKRHANTSDPATLSSSRARRQGQDERRASWPRCMTCLGAPTRQQRARSAPLTSNALARFTQIALATQARRGRRPSSG